MYNNWSLQISNIQYYNNVFIEQKKQFTKPNIMIWASGLDQIGLVVLKNNIFWLSSGIDFANNRYNNGIIQHENNIYRISNGILGYTLNTNGSEVFSNNLNIFRDTIGDPIEWNYNLLPGSVAINFGKDVGLNKDFAGNQIINVPDAGILEYLGSPFVSLKATAHFLPINCYGGITNVSIDATGGKQPYAGIGIFQVKSGFHNFIITDDLGNADTISLFFSEPPKLNINITYDTIRIYGTTTTSIINVTGGVPSYTYNLNGGNYQRSNKFTNVLSGDNIFNVKDSNGCIGTLNATIVDIPIPAHFSNVLLAHVYPNPSSSKFTLYTSVLNGQIYPTTIKIYNAVSGSMVYVSKSNTSRKEIFGADFPPAHYILQIDFAGKSQLIPLLKL